MRRLTQIILIVLVAFAAVGWQTLIVRGHADYERSDPPAGATVAEAPTQVQIWFTQELFRRQGENFIEVYTADGDRVDLNDAIISDDDRTLMTVSLAPDLADGVYTVRWSALSAEDGHAEEGDFTFTVSAAAADAPSAADSEEPTSTPTSTEETSAEEPEPTPVPATTPAESSGGLPCVGSSALIVFALGAVLIGRHGRRR
jgi:methionine-rich copper-binding protein CopC